jgi:hypothetical protein
VITAGRTSGSTRLSSIRQCPAPSTTIDEVLVGCSADDLPCSGSFVLTGPVREVGHDRVTTTPARVVR